MDVNDVCSNCKKAEDQMLMLSCVHDLCINCAANSFAQQIYSQEKNPEVIFSQYLRFSFANFVVNKLT